MAIGELEDEQDGRRLLARGVHRGVSLQTITAPGVLLTHRLAKRLAALGYDVVALDVQVEPAAGVEAVVGDVRDAKLLQGIFQGADVVFHTASYGMSMREQLHTAIIHAVNVQGEAL